MNILLDYHRDGLAIEIPDRNLAGVIEKLPSQPVGNPESIIAEALRSPLGTPPLEELARGRRNACVVIPDVTRPLPNKLLLPPVLAAIEAGGVPPTAIRILIATGLHRPNEGAELEEMLGAVIVRNYAVLNHFARDRESHVNLGQTSSGIPIEVDRRYCESDLKVILGLVEPHFMAGFSGGRKMICPGICAEKTIHRFHGPDLIEHPCSTNCVLDGNLLHRAGTEIARRAGVDFSVNVALNSHRQVIGVFPGELEQAFAAAARRVGEEVFVPLDKPVEIVVLTGGGHPLDATWYQSIKGLVAGLPAMKKGGTMILAASLREGLGSADFQRLLRETKDLSAFMRRIREPDSFRNEQWQLEEFARVAEHADVLLYSDGLPENVQKGLFVEPVRSVGEGLRRALRRHGPDAGIVVMPHGPYLLPALAHDAPDRPACEPKPFGGRRPGRRAAAQEANDKQC